jgi:hypothetical protein
VPRSRWLLEVEFQRRYNHLRLSSSAWPATSSNERIAFNAGSLTDSIVMAADDYLRVAAPQRIFAFSEPGDI